MELSAGWQAGIIEMGRSACNSMLIMETQPLKKGAHSLDYNLLFLYRIIKYHFMKIRALNSQLRKC